MSNILEQYNLRFLNQSSGHQNIKRAVGGGNANIGLLLTEFPFVDDIDELIDNVSTCINGQALPDPSWDGDFICVDITPSGAKFWGKSRGGTPQIVPLADFKQILLKWKSFLNTPPYFLQQVK